MKKTLLYISLMAVVLVLGSCTRNHGDIGPWFGTWAVDAVTVDGQPSDLDPLSRGTAYYLQFQRSVVCLRYTDALHNGGESYGTWSETQDAAGHQLLLVDFDPNSYDVSLMPAHNTFTVEQATSRQLILHGTDGDGSPVTYHLTKQ